MKHPVNVCIHLRKYVVLVYRILLKAIFELGIS